MMILFLKEETYDPFKKCEKAIETIQPNLEKYSWQTMNKNILSADKNHLQKPI